MDENLRVAVEVELWPVEASLLRHLAEADGVSQGEVMGELLRRDYSRRLLLQGWMRERDRDAWRHRLQRPGVTFDELWAAAPWSRD